jgi:hypothetical protein
MAKKKSNQPRWIDVKLTVWKRLYFDPEKANLKELEEVIKRDCSFDYDALIDEELGFTNSELNEDTEEYLPAKENCAPTIEIFNEGGEVLYSNFDPH